MHGTRDTLEGWRSILVVAVVVLLATFAQAGEVRNYGMYLEDKYFLRTEENAGWVTILLREEARATGGPSLWVDPKTDDDPVIRFKDERQLMRLASEVIMPAPANYLKNPGQKYRVTIEGLDICPDYSRIFHVDASNALNAIRSEMAHFIQRAHGVEKDALYYGTVLAMRALNEAQRLPADIPLTVLRSDVGLFRIQGPGLGRRDVGRSQRFSDVESSEGQSFNRVMEDEEALADPNLEPRYKRGSTNDLGRGQSSHFGRQTNPYRNLDPPNYRVEQVKDIKSEPSRYNKPGLPGRPLTVPEVELPPVTASQNLNRDILQGGTLSTADAIAARASKK